MDFLTRKALLLFLPLIFLLLTLLIFYPNLPKIYFYSLFKKVSLQSLLWQTKNWERLEGKHFLVIFRDDREEAELVLETAENLYEPVTSALGFAPPEKIPVVVYPSQQDLQQSFGWEANESAMGVYWTGVIRIVSPQTWVYGKSLELRKREFLEKGPMAHEMVHLVVDYLGRGNYPRWLTEGIAQYYEYKITGFKFSSTSKNSLNQRLYSLAQMDRDFDALPNQSLAYRQSLAAVEYLVEIGGEEVIFKLLAELSRGKTLNQGLKATTGMDNKAFEKNLFNWVKGDRQG